MENVTHALYIAIAALIFIVALSVSMYLVSQLNTTSKVIVWNLNKDNFYDSLELTSMIKDQVTGDQAIVENKSTRIVGVDTIIPTLYRYYKESFAVKIIDSGGNLVQFFDLTTEGDVNNAINKEEASKTDKERALLSLYNNSTDPNKKKINLFGAPWMADRNKLTKLRVDMYVKGLQGYIHDKWVDYSTNNLQTVSNNGAKRFKETYTQYAYEGDTITDENDELVTLVRKSSSIYKNYYYL